MYWLKSSRNCYLGGYFLFLILFFLLPVFPISLPSVFQILVIDYVPDIVFVDDVNFHFLLSFHVYFSEKVGEVVLTDIRKMQL